MSNTADVLLLVRPDFVIFDELRKSEDFEVFSDMRLAGLGMVGVIHANSVQDAIQRFSDRVDFSVLSQVVNTIVFLEKGVVTKIFDVGFTIKVPEGMGSEMHIRPVTTVTDSETGRLVLDIFRYDGQTIVMPVFESTSATPASRIPQVPQIQSIGQPVSHVNKPGSSLSAIPDATPRAPTDERPGWKLTEKEIQREIGRYTDGAVEVEMISDTKVCRIHR